jgi:mono/diheme cytochrome c family protein
VTKRRFACGVCLAFLTCWVALLARPFGPVAAVSARQAGAAELARAASAVIEANCLACHGEGRMGGLDLRSRAAALKGGARGPAVVPGKAVDSLLWKAVAGGGELQMPPGRKRLTAGEVKLLGEWIDAGAQWPEGAAAAAKNSEPSWWSFRKPVRPAVPAVKDAAWVKTPVDAFVLSELEAKGLRPAPPADRQTLVRRAYFDLTGLPPTPEQVSAFLADDSPDAYEKLVDKLLSSPRYGERWGRFWLDLVRYADTGGFEHDLYFPNAWRYRDWVIKSFNDDKPYDQFVQEQIAADEIWPNDLALEGSYELPKQKQIDLERRIGTGMYTVGTLMPVSGLNPDLLRSEWLADAADVTGAAFMGLTFGCARCHDHKFDPIPQRDYFRLQAVFAASEEQEIPLVDVMKVYDYQKATTKWVAVEELKAALKGFESKARLRRVEAQLPAAAVAAARVAPELRGPRERELAAEYERAVKAAPRRAKGDKLELTPEERREKARLEALLVERLLEAPTPYATANVLGHAEKIRDVHIEVRGDYKNRREQVNAGLPSAFGDGRDLIDPTEPRRPTHRRKDFALWLTRPDHPLTARVMVNRIWQGHFGAGLVRTPNDFGRQGEAPSHPALLDWLATEFVRQKWSVKQMHRLLMLSNTYQMSNRHDGAAARVDGENRLLWRMNRRRLEAEAVRDAILAAAGSLNLKMYGVPVVVGLSKDEMEGVKNLYQWNPAVDEAEWNRRSVYLYVKRGFRFPLFEIFDAPDNSFSCPRRDVTNVAPQALALLNNDFVHRQAEIFAARLRRECGDDAARWVETGWQLALGRTPTSEERAKALEVFAAPGDAALVKFCLLLYNLNEFVYVD